MKKFFSFKNRSQPLDKKKVRLVNFHSKNIYNLLREMVTKNIAINFALNIRSVRNKVRSDYNLAVLGISWNFLFILFSIILYSILSVLLNLIYSILLFYLFYSTYRILFYSILLSIYCFILLYKYCIQFYSIMSSLVYSILFHSILSILVDPILFYLILFYFI